MVQRAILGELDGQRFQPASMPYMPFDFDAPFRIRSRDHQQLHTGAGEQTLRLLVVRADPIHGDGSAALLAQYLKASPKGFSISLQFVDPWLRLSLRSINPAPALRSAQGMANQLLGGVSSEQEFRILLELHCASIGVAILRSNVTRQVGEIHHRQLSIRILRLPTRAVGKKERIIGTGTFS